MRKGSVIQLDRGGDLQSALEQARPGDTIILQAGAVYEGPFTLPVKSGNEFITIQSSRAERAAGGRSRLPFTVSSVCKNTVRRKGFADRKDRTPKRIITSSPALNSPPQMRRSWSTISSGSETNEQTTLESVPHHLVIDRSYIHGFPTQDVQRGIALNSAETSITNSYISDVHGRGYDTQAICGWNGPGPFKIINNYLEGAGENVMFGGADRSHSKSDSYRYRDPRQPLFQTYELESGRSQLCR